MEHRILYNRTIKNKDGVRMKQQSFSDIEYSNRRRKTKREEFLDSMNEIIPWSHWIRIIQPYYYNNKRGRKPIDLEIMLRMYLMQNCSIFPMKAWKMRFTTATP